ncbi:MAG: FRG domain-containing protein [Schleiferiaceae bacterium]|nr:FRG domain-containing protein [Schleiferiaceae bacterium]
MVKTFKVKSWADFQDKLFYDTHDDRIDRFRSPYIYRGLNNAQDSLTTSLHRLGGESSKLERHLLRNFKKYAHSSELPGNNIWNWIALAQHHGLPTRLLDWTYSPLVAAHFALTELDSFQNDGVIWALNYVNLNKYLPDKLKIVIEKERSNTFTAEMLLDACSTIDDLEKLSNDPYLLFLEPPSLDDRIVNQYALFSLMSNPVTQLQDWLPKDKFYYFKIIIPKELKWEFRDKLDQANITERVLKPGLDGLSQWLKRHYSSKS